MTTVRRCGTTTISRHPIAVNLIIAQVLGLLYWVTSDVLGTFIIYGILGMMAVLAFFIVWIMYRDTEKWTVRGIGLLNTLQATGLLFSLIIGAAFTPWHAERISYMYALNTIFAIYTMATVLLTIGTVEYMRDVSRGYDRAEIVDKREPIAGEDAINALRGDNPEGNE